MKLEKRQKYLDLITLTHYGLCNFCKHASWEGNSPCDTYLICEHPLEAISGEDNYEKCNDVWAGSSDCWGFAPNKPFEEIGKFVGICLEGNMPHYSHTYKELIAIVPSERDKKELF